MSRGEPRQIRLTVSQARAWRVLIADADRWCHVGRSTSEPDDPNPTISTPAADSLFDRGLIEATLDAGRHRRVRLSLLGRRTLERLGPNLDGQVTL